MGQLINLTDKKFSRLTVIKRAKNRNKMVYWLCKCECGKLKEIGALELYHNRTKSCGCLMIETSRKIGKILGKLPKKIKHGMTKSPEYSSWLNMRARCKNKRQKSYKCYGGRGIKVCEKWQKSFDSFFKDMGPKPGPDYSIDRIDVNGDYEPNNCRWATNQEQALNKRNNLYIEHNGLKKTITQWSKELINGRQNTIRERLNRGWSLQEALTLPCKKIK